MVSPIDNARDSDPHPLYGCAFDEEVSSQIHADETKRKKDNIHTAKMVCFSKSEIAIQDGPNDKYLSISRLKPFFISDQSIHDTSYCLQANNCPSLHIQHHGKGTSFPSWFYVRDKYLSCPRTILGSIFHP